MPSYRPLDDDHHPTGYPSKSSFESTSSTASSTRFSNRFNDPESLSDHHHLQDDTYSIETKYPPDTELKHQRERPDQTESHDPRQLTPSSSSPIKDFYQPTVYRPPVWKRIFWDTTPLDQRIMNHRNGVGIQDRAYVCWILSLGMLIALIIELVVNTQYQGTPIATKPTFNFMLGPSAEVLINTGARFTPCIKYVSAVSNIPFPCLNSTSSESTCTQSLESICGFSGFAKPGQPDQKFRFVLPLFLHAGLIHYALNIAVQLTSSALIERQMGSLRFILLYLPSGIFGFILGGNFSLVGQPSVGASGAIFSTYAAVLVDLISHWSIEFRPARKLVFLLLEIVAGLLLGLIPGIDNFSHIGGFSMGLLLAILLYPVLHQTITHRWTFYAVRVMGFIGAILMFVLLYRNFFLEDPAASCNWCRYLSCWPTASNNRCQGTGLKVTETTITTPVNNPSNQTSNPSTSSSALIMALPALLRLTVSLMNDWFLSTFRKPKAPKTSLSSFITFIRTRLFDFNSFFLIHITVHCSGSSFHQNKHHLASSPNTQRSCPSKNLDTLNFETVSSVFRYIYTHHSLTFCWEHLHDQSCAYPQFCAT